MNKKKQPATKIILKLVIFVFVISIFQLALPTQAATTNISNLYSNPNQNNNNNPYKFKVSDVINSNLLTNVVGCTGVVNKVSTWMMKFLQSPIKQAEMTADKLKKVREQLKSTCSSVKAGAETAAGVTPIVNDLVSTVKTIFSKIKTSVNGDSVKACLEQVDAINDEQLDIMVKEAERDNETKLKEQCFDGIAITLAKNQLTAMTRSMMNWVNSGYGGNPFFVQNMTSFTNRLEQNVLETGIDILLSPNNQNPYASDFARSAVTSRGIRSSSSNFLGNLQSDLGYFLTDPRSYYTEENLSDAEKTQMALQRAREANNAFANDFLIGGWDGWLALTQRDQNNPLGFTMLASDSLANKIAFETQNVRDELQQNDGFLSQKICVKWQQYDEKGNPVTSVDNKGKVIFAFSDDKRENYPDKCAEDGWKTITPGSIIQEKTTSYLNSPERQLELAKTINDSLNALFSILISKLTTSGLSGLSDSNLKNTTNWTDNLNNFTSPDGNSTYNNNGAYNDFDLTRDLGNTYIHDTFINLGEWDAKNNLTSKKEKLYPDGIYDAKGNAIVSSNTYYTVSTAGNTKLILEGYNGWVVGDRVFWNGSEWQNWKKGQTNPIKKRGVIQIQQDYIIAAKEILKVLPSVMTNLGELDYCIPGPNPSYKTNSTNAQSAYQDWSSSMFVGPVDNTNERWGVKIDKAGDRTYENLYNIYSDNPGVWNLIQKSIEPLIYAFSNICNSSGRNCTGYYTYIKGADFTNDDVGHLAEKKEMMDFNSDYVNNNLFQSFYEIFDKMMNRLYFKNMTSMYIEYENKSLNTQTDKNPDYIPMAENGLDLTKNIIYYNDDITKATQDYTDAMNQAKINIAKLEPIKTEVSEIIKAAQDRRNERLVTILGIPLGEIQNEYAECFDEENIQFYDDTDIMNDSGGDEASRCFDNIDNDLDGLIDKLDPDCDNVAKGYCSDGETSSTTFNFINKPCVERETSLSCTTIDYYHSGNKTKCMWIKY